MQLLTTDIKDNFSAKITRISLAIVPAWNPSWKSSAPEDVGTYWNSHPSLQILLLPLAPCGSIGCTQLRTQPWLCISLHLFGLKPAGCLIWSFAFTCSFSKLLSGLSSCVPGVFRQEQAPGWQRWTCVFAMNRASWLSAGYSNPTRSQPNIIQSLRPHLKMFHHHSESKQGLAEPREGKWRKIELWTPSGFSCWCFSIITMVRVRLGARISLPCMLFSQHPSLSSVGILAEELLQKLQILQHK